MWCQKDFKSFLDHTGLRKNFNEAKNLAILKLQQIRWFPKKKKFVLKISIQVKLTKISDATERKKWKYIRFFVVKVMLPKIAKFVFTSEGVYI